MVTFTGDDGDMDAEVVEADPQALRVTKRESSPKKLTPLGLVFEAGVPQHSYSVTVVKWSEAAHAQLKALSEILRAQTPRIDLPVISLRGRLELVDPNNLRLERTVGRFERSGTILWTRTGADSCREAVNAAVLGWLVDQVTALTINEAGKRIVEQLKTLARSRRAVEAYQREAKPYTWDESLGKTAKAVSSTSYADLANFVAIHLEGKEVFPGLPGLRRIAMNQLEQNQAELITEPILVGRSHFSLVTRIRVFSYPGRPTPVVAIEFSRRIWATSIRERATVKSISAFAFPEGSSRAFQFSLSRKRDEQGVWSYQPDDDFAPIARRFFPGEPLTTDAILKNGHTLKECKLLVVLKQGVGERSDVKVGVPDLDKMEAFERVAAALKEIHLVPWQGLQEVDSSTRPTVDRDQHWRKRDSDKQPDQKKYTNWLEEAQRSIQECYAGEHRIIIAVQPGAEADAQFAEDRLREILKGSVTTKRIPISPYVHGPRGVLPGKEIKNPADRAAKRIAEWGAFIEVVKRYEATEGGKIDGVLVIAREWYAERQHDDVVNKRAGRLALAKELGVPIQYLRPRGEDRETIEAQPARGKSRSPEEIAAEIDRKFEDRLMIAWLDLAFKSLGRVRPRKLLREAEGLYDSHTYPDRILALGVVRRNKSRFLLNERSFLPYAIELDVDSGVCEASYAYEDPETGEGTWTNFLPMPQALVNLAGLGPVQLTTTKEGEPRRQQLIERTQRFFQHCLTNFGQRSKRPLVLIDADSSRSVWPWLKDEEIDPNNVRLADGFHAQASWPKARLVRVRSDNSPKVLWDTEFFGTVEQTGEEIRYRAPDWADAELFKVTDVVKTQVYISFGSAIRKTRTRGKSCYREIPGMKMVRKPHGYIAATLSRHTDAWTTPIGLEIVVVRSGDDEPDQVARLVEWLRQCYAHFGEWTGKPAPLFFESALKQHLADYDLEEDDSEEEGEEEGE